MERRGSILVVCAALASAVPAGCRARVPASVAPAAGADDGRFPHDAHGSLRCTECHELAAVLAGQPARPGSRDHAPCDRERCHQAEFLATPGPLCGVCHDEVSPTEVGRSPLAPYPPTYGRRILASRFSHAVHLDFERLERQVGFHVVCTDCHDRDPAGEPRAAGHAVCGRCHAPEAAPPGTPAMDRCAACHRPQDRELLRTRRLIVGDLHFSHANHQSDRRGVTILCVECHADSPTARRVGDHPPPDTQACVGCHDDSDRTPSNQRMRVCETCHATRSRNLGVLAPRSHLPPLERPEDHTLAFRRDHAADALARPADCARCHTFMSKSTRDVCDECHQVMRPHDHTVTWREFDHGPAASARADSCARCHRATFCTACHARRPRSHWPALEFDNGGHAVRARGNLRACLTCHDPALSCDRCHLPGAAR